MLVGDGFGQQHMRHALVRLKFHHLGVDEQHPEVVGRILVYHTAKQAVQEHALTRAAGTCDQRVGEFGDVAHIVVVVYILAQSEIKPLVLIRTDKFGRIDDGFESHRSPFLVRHFHADKVLSADRRFYTNAVHHQAGAYVLFQLGDLAHGYGARHLQLKARKRGSFDYVHHFRGHFEVLKRALKLRRHSHIIFIARGLFVIVIQKVHLGRRVPARFDGYEYGYAVERTSVLFLLPRLGLVRLRLDGRGFDRFRLYGFGLDRLRLDGFGFNGFRLDFRRFDRFGLDSLRLDGFGLDGFGFYSLGFDGFGSLFRLSEELRKVVKGALTVVGHILHILPAVVRGGNFRRLRLF